MWHVATAIILIDVCLLAPILGFTLYRFHHYTNDPRHSQNPSLRNSYPTITENVIILGIIFIGLYHPSLVISDASPIKYIYSDHIYLQTLIDINIRSFFTIFWAGALLSLCRYWLMFYDLKYTNSNINLQWKSYINHRIITKDFWVNYKPILGNQRFMIKTTLTLIIIMVIITQILLYIWPCDQHRLFWLVTCPIMFLIPSSFIAILYFNAPDIEHSVIHFKHEISSAITLVILFMVPVIVLMKLGELGDKIHSVLWTFLTGISIYLYVYVSSGWMLSRYLKDHSQILEEGEDVSDNEESYDLGAILSNEKLTNEVMQSVASKMSISSVLCIIEMVQFKYLIKQQYANSSIFLSNDGENPMDEDESLVTIPENEELLRISTDRSQTECDYSLYGILNNVAIPKSSIVFESNEHETIEDFLEIAHKLYLKYLDVQNDNYGLTELTVNVSVTLRKCYAADMNIDSNTFITSAMNKGMNIKDLFQYFDPVIQSLYHEITDLQLLS